MKFLIGLTAFIVFVAVYVTWGRPWLRTTGPGKALLDWIEPIERVLWWKSETILWQRFKVFIGSFLTLLVGIDWNSVSPLIPEKYRGIVLALPTIFVAVDGLIGEKLRKDTTKPLEIVAMRTDAPAEVKEAAAMAEGATAQAVEVAKESGSV